MSIQEKKPDEKSLIHGILKCDTKGIFAYQLPEFRKLLKFLGKWPKKISFGFETFSSLVDIYTPQTEDLKACIVGGMSDKTSGTLSPPDLDLNVEWHIKDNELLQLLQIHTLEDGASGQYQIQVQCSCIEK